MGSCTPRSLPTEDTLITSSINISPSDENQLKESVKSESLTSLKSNRNGKDSGRIVLVKKPTVFDAGLLVRWRDPKFTGE